MLHVYVDLRGKMWKIWWILAEFEVKELEEALEKLKIQMDEAFAAFLRRAPCPPPHLEHRRHDGFV